MMDFILISFSLLFSFPFIFILEARVRDWYDLMLHISHSHMNDVTVTLSHNHMS